MNLHTACIKTMIETSDATERNLYFKNKVGEMLEILRELGEDSLFVNSIDSEQEIALDRFKELLEGIQISFEIADMPRGMSSQEIIANRFIT